ncbi:MAG TPA: serine hydrolase [Terriglobales bacterium]
MNGNIAVSVKGKNVYQQSFGYRDVLAREPNDADSQFELASISKVFTATAVLQLKERRQIDLDTPFQKYFPEFPYAKITARHLLAHTSGLPDTEELLEPLIKKDPQRQFTIHDDMKAIIAYSQGHNLRFDPGEKWSYSSVGYHLLALLVEKTSGQSLPDYLKNHIFTPARMTHTFVQTSMSQKDDPVRTKTYQYNNHFEMKLELMDTLSDWKEWTYNLAMMTGGSGIVSTSGDMLLFDKALNQGKLLKPQSLEEAYTPYRLNNGQPAEPFDITYSGLGWFIFKDHSHGRIVWASGANPGVISFFARNLDRKQAIVVLHNVKCDPFVDIKALDILTGNPVMHRSSLAFAYAQDLFAKGPDYANSHFQELKADTGHFQLSESELDRASLEFRRAGLKSQAIAICVKHIESFPKSTDGHKDYAATLAQYGQKDEAIKEYKKVLELDPDDAESKKDLNSLTGN